MPNPNYATLLAQIAAESDSTAKQALIDQCYVFTEALTENEKELFEYSAFGYVADNPKDTSSEVSYEFQQLIESSDNAVADQFGRSISVSGNTFASGAPTEDANGANAGAVYIFTTSDNGASYTQQQKIISNGGSIASAGDHFGRCVDLDGDTLAISSPRDLTTTHNTANTGSVEIWNRTNNTWSFTQKLIPPTAGDLFAAGNEAVSLSGNYLAVSNKLVDDDSATIPRGATRVYKKTDSTWSLHQTLRAPSSLFNLSTYSDSQSSETVCLKGKWLVTSFQTYSTDSLNNVGRAIVYKRNDSTGLYEQDVILAPTADVADQQFGYALDITNVDGDTPRIALTSRDTPRHTIYIFERNSSGSWSIINNIDNIIDPTADDNSYGGIVRISGDNLIIGNQGFDTDAGVANAGRAFHYEYNGSTTWTQRQIFNGTDTVADSSYGFAMDISDDGNNYVLICEPGKPQGDGTQKGFVRAYADRATSYVGVYFDT